VYHEVRARKIASSVPNLSRVATVNAGAHPADFARASLHLRCATARRWNRLNRVSHKCGAPSVFGEVTAAVDF
jgi:hypothetical protein